MLAIKSKRHSNGIRCAGNFKSFPIKILLTSNFFFVSSYNFQCIFILNTYISTYVLVDLWFPRQLNLQVKKLEWKKISISGKFNLTLLLLCLPFNYHKFNLLFIFVNFNLLIITLHKTFDFFIVYFATLWWHCKKGFLKKLCEFKDVFLFFKYILLAWRTFGASN